MNLFDLTGKKALVTGSSRGLGRGMAEGLMVAGAEVVIMGTRENILDIAAGYNQDGLRCHGLVADLSRKENVEAAYHAGVSLLGGSLDILVNAAGVQRRHPATDFPYSDWQAVLAINLDAVFILCQLAGRAMIRQGKGKIINVASMMSFFGGITVPAYAASKGGLTQLTKALANEWTGRGVCVNAIAPGYMDTDMNVRLVNDPVRNREILGRIPAGRWGVPDDMKGITVFLASAASDYISGAIIPVDGAYLAR
jgi:2-deoxy-D-gluconate 3-dehydrogenase